MLPLGHMNRGCCPDLSVFFSTGRNEVPRRATAVRLSSRISILGRYGDIRNGVALGKLDRASSLFSATTFTSPSFSAQKFIRPRGHFGTHGGEGA